MKAQQHRSERGAPRYAVVVTARDLIVWAGLSDFLTASGFEAAPAERNAADAAVVLLSRSAVEDPEWQAAVAALDVPRVIPVRVDDVVGPSVPAVLEPLHWIQWNHASPATTFGAVAAALQSEPGAVLSSRELLRSARAWDQAARDPGVLTDSPRRAKQLRRLLDDLEGDPMAAPGPLVRAYVFASSERARARRRRRWGTRTVLAVTVIGAVTAFAAAIPGFREARSVGRAGFVSASADSPQRLPEWIAVSSAFVLLSGPPEQGEVLRPALIAAINEPWTLGPIDPGADHGVENGVPVGSEEVVALFGNRSGTSAVARYHVATGTYGPAVGLPGRYHLMDVDGDDGLVAIGGASGVVVVDLAKGSTQVLSTDESRTVEWSGRSVVSVDSDDRVVRLPLDGSPAQELMRDDALIQVVATESGAVRGLVSDSKGGYAIVDALTGLRVAEMKGDPPATTAGGLSTGDDILAYVAGARGELWRLTPGGAEGTGIAIADRTDVIVPLPDDRVLVGGAAETMRVVHVPTAGELGVVCREMVRLTAVQTDPLGTRVVCLSQFDNDVWAVPPAPDRLRGAPPEGSASIALPEGRIRVEGRDLVFEPEAGSTRRLEVFERGTGVALTQSPDGARLLVVSDRGETVVVPLSGPGTVTGRWVVPGGGVPVDVRWKDRPQVVTSDGLVWEVPDRCPNCHRDVGIVTAVRDRIHHCWQELQLRDITSEAREILGIDVCPSFAEQIERG